MGTGSLTVLGTGIQLVGHVSLAAVACIKGADKVFYVVVDPVIDRWINDLNPSAESLSPCYRKGKPRWECYEEMTDRILAAVRNGMKVCAVFYGHPSVCVAPSRDAVRRTREEGFEARILPGISALDCLYADLDVDPAGDGCQTFEATDFLIQPRRIDHCSALILLQVGFIGEMSIPSRINRKGLKVLVDVLRKSYPNTHEVILYEAAVYPICDPAIKRVRLKDLPRAKMSIAATLYVPPLQQPRLNSRIVKLLGMDRYSQNETG